MSSPLFPQPWRWVPTPIARRVPRVPDASSSVIFKPPPRGSRESARFSAVLLPPRRRATAPIARLPDLSRPRQSRTHALPHRPSAPRTSVRRTTSPRPPARCPPPPAPTAAPAAPAPPSPRRRPRRPRPAAPATGVDIAPPTPAPAPPPRRRPLPRDGREHRPGGFPARRP